MSDAHTRALVIDQLRPAIASAIQHHPQRRAHVVRILQTCLNYDGGVRELLSLVHEMEQETSLALRRLMATVDRWLPDGYR